jgi:FkbM family methyltransferase
MNYKTLNQYTSNSTIRSLGKNDKLSMEEKFEVNIRGRNFPVTYCHPKVGKDAAALYKPEYNKFFNEFLNTNERFIPDGSYAIDIGAYDGDTTLPIAALCGRNGLVYSFECGEAFMSQFSINSGLNPHLNIVGVPLALMPTTGIHEFLYSPDDYNGGHHSTNSWVGTYTVPRLIRGVSFKDFSSNQDLSKISFIKVDTEGHDFHILLSFKEFIKQVRPVLHVEWFPRTDPYMRQLVEYLGYSIFCGFTLEHIVLGQSQWRQDLVLVPKEKINQFQLTV